MNSFIYHIQINVSDKGKSFGFYKDLLKYLGYNFVYEGKDDFGMTNGGTDIWVIETAKKHKEAGYHRKRTGVNHICFGVGSKEEVDKFKDEFLSSRKIATLYNSPKEYPEYTEGYYAVFFEDPDRIKLEITYIPGFENRVRGKIVV